MERGGRRRGGRRGIIPYISHSSVLHAIIPHHPHISFLTGGGEGTGRGKGPLPHPSIISIIIYY